MMISPYKALNWFYIHNIPFLPLAVRGDAVNCRVGSITSKQKVFIPKRYFNIDEEKGIMLKENVNLEWFWRKKNTQNNVKKFLGENYFKSEVE